MHLFQIIFVLIISLLGCTTKPVSKISITPKQSNCSNDCQNTEGDTGKRTP